MWDVCLSAAFLLSRWNPLGDAGAWIGYYEVGNVSVAVRLRSINCPASLHFYGRLMDRLLRCTVVALSIHVYGNALNDVLAGSGIVHFHHIDLNYGSSVSRAFAIKGLAGRRRTGLVMANGLLSMFIATVFSYRVIRVIAIRRIWGLEGRMFSFVRVPFCIDLTGVGSGQLAQGASVAAWCSVFSGGFCSFLPGAGR